MKYSLESFEQRKTTKKAFNKRSIVYDIFPDNDVHVTNSNSFIAQTK